MCFSSALKTQKLRQHSNTLHMLNVMNTLTLTKGGLEGELRHYRRQQAYVNAIPAMNMLGNSILKKIIATRPSTLKQL